MTAEMGAFVEVIRKDRDLNSNDLIFIGHPVDDPHQVTAVGALLEIDLFLATFRRFTNLASDAGCSFWGSLFPEKIFLVIIFSRLVPVQGGRNGDLEE